MIEEPNTNILEGHTQYTTHNTHRNTPEEAEEQMRIMIYDET